MAETKRSEEPATTTKGYLEQMTRRETDKRHLVSSSDSDSSDEEHVNRRPLDKLPNTWWFQHREVKRNWLLVLGAWFLVCLSIGCFGVGIVLEILYHKGLVDMVRGFILMIVGVVLLIPSGYAVTHVYLAARKVGRIRMKSVWFFQ